MVFAYKRWHEQNYLLDALSFRGLVKAYVTYPAIQAYALLFALSAAASVALAEQPPALVWPVVGTLVAYPMVEYLLHRFVLHGRWLYRSPRTAALWRRIHFDHHQNPNDLAVLFGALHTTLPVIALVAVPIGWLSAGVPGILAGLATGFSIISLYEFCHCIQHLSYKPKRRYLQRIKRLHLAHHFHNETGNFGITTFFWDRVLATYYDKPGEMPRSPTVRNLGYVGAEREKYPWVADQIAVLDKN